MVMRIQAIAIICLLSLAGTVWGAPATYYVAPGNAQCTAASTPNACCTGSGTGTCTGDDAAAGDAAHPWATMNYAESQLAASGDTVHVAAGKYYETDASVHCFNPIKSAAWIVDGPVEVHPDASGTKAMRWSGTGTISFTGFTFDAKRPDGTAQANVIFDATTNSTNKTLTNCTLQNSTSVALYGNASGYPVVASSGTSYLISAGVGLNSGNITSTGDTFTLSGTATAIWAGVNGRTETLSFTTPTIGLIAGSIGFDLNGNTTFTIDGGTTTMTGAVASLVDATRTGAVDVGTITVQNHTITGNTATTAPIVTASTGQWDVFFTDNTVTSLASAQVQPVVSVIAPVDQVAANVAVTLSGNTITTTGTSNLRHFLVKSTGETVLLTIDGNTNTSASTGAAYVYHIGSETTSEASCVGATACVDDTIQATITDNIISAGNTSSVADSSPAIHNIFVGHQNGSIIRRNLSQGGGYGIVLKHSAGSGSDTADVSNNKLINNKWGIIVKGQEGANVYNNTFVNTRSGATMPLQVGVQISDNGGLHSPVNVKLANNIIQSSGNGAIGIYSYAAALPAGFDSDYNSIYLSGTSPIYAQVNTDMYNWAQWQALGGAGYDEHSINASAPLTAMGGPQSTFLGINTGTDVCATLVDSTDINGSAVCTTSAFAGHGWGITIGAEQYAGASGATWWIDLDSGAATNTGAASSSPKDSVSGFTNQQAGDMILFKKSGGGWPTRGGWGH